ncbi:ABC transporter ATP-binding protein [Agilicoccus flavus]|uniref:ABC transporter ATP-binding protein n=1 Tax=Agilicoccus flavus TaxID=2775968 RepID=UPI001CF63616|nr:ABC transporter ATP-binding protein [Agilicoccus flavus]
MTLHADAVSWDRGGNLVVDGVTLRTEPGETVGLLGPNGSGKSSLLRLMHGAARPSRGRVLLGDADLTGLGRREVARSIAVVQQHAHSDVDLAVRDVVRLGRIPYRSLWGGDQRGDDEAVERALVATGMDDRAGRAWHTLSGGERQRVHIARALAQEPKELLMDEPTNHLDIRHQLEILTLVTRLPVTTVVALHDLGLAAMFCDRVMVLCAGRAVAAGRPADVLTQALIADVYGVRADVSVDGDGLLRVHYCPGAPADVAPAAGPGRGDA